MDIHELRNAAEKIEGYLIARPQDKPGEAIERARVECLKNLRRQVECVAALTPEQFRSAFRRLARG